MSWTWGGGGGQQEVRLARGLWSGSLWLVSGFFCLFLVRPSGACQPPRDSGWSRGESTQLPCPRVRGPGCEGLARPARGVAPRPPTRPHPGVWHRRPEAPPVVRQRVGDGSSEIGLMLRNARGPVAGHSLDKQMGLARLLPSPRPQCGMALPWAQPQPGPTPPPQRGQRGGALFLRGLQTVWPAVGRFHGGE